ncbi:MAG: SEL1-like repeat protein [Ruminococcus sp.]|nr:SEL1-like repeat protein [Ruminococcus sp.]
MPRLVVVSRYLKSGSGKNLSNYVKYIATREGAAVVKENNGTAPATKAQQELITSLLKDFSDSKNSFAFEEYRSNPTQKNASRFIEETIEHNSDIVANKKNYVGYLANRPGAVKFGSHGLFSQTDEPISLKKVAKEVSEHKGNIWTHVVSLRRDDAQKMGYDNLTAWRELIKRQIPNIAKQSKIDMANLKWYAAFHDKETNPHVHIVVYSTNEREGFLTEHGIEKIRSGFMNDIYADELKHLYQQQTEARDLLKAESAKLMKQLSSIIADNNCIDMKIVDLMRKLHGQLQNTKGKKVYGYLQKDTKQTVDEIFFRLSQNDTIQKMYRLWCDMEQSKHDFYSSAKVDFPSMVDNEQFKSVKNMIIQAASEIRFDFQISENDDITDEIEEDNDSGYYYDYDAPQNAEEEQTDNTRMYIKWSEEYKAAVKVLADKESSDNEKFQALQQLRAEADKGNILAMHDIGKYSDESYYEKALQGFLQIEPSAKKLRPYIQYRIGKMYLYGSGTEKAPETAFKWLEQSAIAGNKYAQHNLANMFCYGTGTQKDLSKAFLWYSEAARLGMRFADYALAQMYYYGSGVEQNIELAQEHYRKALFAFLSYDKDEKLLYKIGRMYYCGLGTEVDKPKALKYLSESAEQGNMQAKRIFAQELLHGEFIPQDIPRGLAMLTECADSGDTSAAYKLGKVYFKGEYVPADHDRAESYLKIAVADNNRDAMYTLAKLYLTDKRKNVHQAIKLLEAVAPDNMWASYWLGRIYYFGADDVAPDREKGMVWLMRSVADGNIYAQSIIDNGSDHENALFAESVIGLLSSLSRIISDDYDRQQRKLSSQVDKKLRRALDRKKQELGIKLDYYQMH